jgi:hypothetical protein
MVTRTLTVNGARRNITVEDEAEAIAYEAAFEAEARALADAPKVLSKVRFEWMLAITGLDRAWTALEDWAVVTAPETYAALRANRAATTFRQDKTLAMIAELRQVLDQIAPEFDLTDQAIKDAWAQAEAAAF